MNMDAASAKALQRKTLAFGLLQDRMASQLLWNRYGPSGVS